MSEFKDPSVITLTVIKTMNRNSKNTPCGLSPSCWSWGQTPLEREISSRPTAPATLNHRSGSL